MKSQPDLIYEGVNAGGEHVKIEQWIDKGVYLVNGKAAGSREAQTALASIVGPVTHTWSTS